MSVSVSFFLSRNQAYITDDRELNKTKEYIRLGRNIYENLMIHETSHDKSLDARIAIYNVLYS